MKANEHEKAAVKSLFEFVKEFDGINKAVVRNLENSDGVLYLREVDGTLPGVEKWTPGAGITAPLLSVTKQILPNAPEVPDVLIGWLASDPRDYKADPEFLKSLTVKVETQEEGETHEKTVLFTDDPERISARDKWLQLFLTWQQNCQRFEKTNSLFSLLVFFSSTVAHSNLKQQCVAGNFIFRSHLKDRANARYPLISVPLEIRMLEGDVPRLVVEINKDERRLFNDTVLQGFDEKVLDLTAFAQAKELLASEHPFASELLRNIFKNKAVLFSDACRWCDEGASASGLLYSVCEDPCILIEKRPSGVPGAIESIIKTIDQTGEVPEHLLDLVCPERHVPGVVFDDREPTPAERLAATAGEDKEILLTKPANTQQLNIAKRIANNQMLLVQGPPGTGKTHTIANLIGHFLSEGLRVLVTSEKVKALSVLKQKLPKEVRSLCVSKLGDKKDLETTAQSLSSKLDELDLRKLKKEIEACSEKRREVLSNLEKIRQEIYQLRCQDQQTINYCGDSYSLNDLAKKLKVEEAELRPLIPGKVEQCDVFLTEEELSVVYGDVNRWSAEDRSELQKTLPASADLTKPEKVRIYLDQIEQCRKAKNEDSQAIEVTKICDEKGNDLFVYTVSKEQIYVPGKSSDRFFDLGVEVPKLDGIDPLVRYAYLIGVTPEAENYAHLQKLQCGLAESAKKARELTEKEFVEAHNIELADTYPLDALKSTAVWFREKHPDGNVGGFSKFFGGFSSETKSHLAQIDAIRINQRRPKTADEFSAVITHIELLEELNRIGSFWKRLATRIGVETPEDLSLSFFKKRAGVLTDEIADAMVWWQGSAEPYLASLAKLHVTGGALDAIQADTDAAGKFSRLAQFCTSVTGPLSRAHQSQKKFENYKQLIAGARDQLIPFEHEYSVVVSGLQAGLDGDFESYRVNFERLRHLEAERSRFERYSAAMNKLGDLAPEWRKALEEHRPGFDSPEVPAQIFEAWKWHQLNLICTELLGQTIEERQQEAQRLSALQRELTAQLAADKAWFKVKERLEGSGRETLAALMQLMKQLKKANGSGKGAEAARHQAAELMPKCEEAIPVWIMTIDDALRSFGGSANFDLAIVDEASQADTTALPVLYMAKKVIVVGDDKQVTPLSIGKKDNLFAGIRDQYLTGKVKNPHNYDAKLSLYEFIKLGGASSVMLTEHFRCVPEIIGWCNRMFYRHEIKPLRDETSSKLKPAINLWRVDGHRDANDFNQAEGIAAIRLIRSMMKTSQYNEKTFGIISMLGKAAGGAANARMLQLIENEFTPEEIKKRQIVYGNSADFQGDERDVMILCMMDASARPGEILRKTAENADETMSKRYNVAVSRARDQIWIVHSFDWETQLKHDDIRYKLYQWVKELRNGTAFEAEVAKHAESGFETAVGKALKMRGYSFDQQFYVGGFRLDFVVRYMGRAVALECDGERYHSSDEDVCRDMERQCMLERNGWRFVRLRSGEFYRDPDAAIDRICAKFHALGIDPSTDVTAQQTTPLFQHIRNVYQSLSLSVKSETLLEEASTSAVVSPFEPENAPDVPAVKAETKLADRVPVKAPTQTEWVSEVSAFPSHDPEKKQAGNHAPVKANVVDAAEMPEEDNAAVSPDARSEAEPAPARTGTEKKPVPEKAKADAPAKPQTPSKPASAAKPASQKRQVLTVKPAAERAKVNNGEPPTEVYSKGILTDAQKQQVLREDADFWKMATEAGIKIIDKRPHGGGLWILGGDELKDFVSEVHKELKLTFLQAKNGSRALHYQPGWWMTNKYRAGAQKEEEK